MRIENSTYYQQPYGQYGNQYKPNQSEKNSPENNKQSVPQDAAQNQQKLQQEVQQLKTTEQKVIAHEMAHMAVGGQYAGAVSYKYTRGPDGKMYIAGGEVSIDISEAKSPEATIEKMQQVERAALAPADPSAQDRKVAAAATKKEQTAYQELAQAQNTAKTSKSISVYA